MKIRLATLEYPVGCSPDDAVHPDLRECAHVSTVWSGPGLALFCDPANGGCGQVWS